MHDKINMIGVIVPVLIVVILIIVWAKRTENKYKKTSDTKKEFNQELKGWIELIESDDFSDRYKQVTKEFYIPFEIDLRNYVRFYSCC